MDENIIMNENMDVNAGDIIGVILRWLLIITILVLASFGLFFLIFFDGTISGTITVNI